MIIRYHLGSHFHTDTDLFPLSISLTHYLTLALSLSHTHSTPRLSSPPCQASVHGKAMLIIWCELINKPLRCGLKLGKRREVPEWLWACSYITNTPCLCKQCICLCNKCIKRILRHFPTVSASAASVSYNQSPTDSNFRSILNLLLSGSLNFKYTYTSQNDCLRYRPHVTKLVDID